MIRFLILGGSGYLGSRVTQLLPNSYGTFFSKSYYINQNMIFFDGSDPNEFQLIVERVKPDVVINCIGFTDVDLCDELPEKCWKLNASYPFYYAEVCKKYDIKFVQISTDHYYNSSGLKLQEKDYCEAINYYGFSKLFAERIILEVNPSALVARTNFFHFNFQTPVTFLDNLIIKSEIRQSSFSFSDVIFTPISTNTLVQSLYRLIELGQCGVINISGSEALSKFEFHKKVLEVLGLSTKLHYPISVDKTLLSAPRPKYMALDNKNFESRLNYKIPSIYAMIKDEVAFAKKKVGSGVNR